MWGVVVTDGFHFDGCCLPLLQMRRLSQSLDYGAQSHGLFTCCLRLTTVLRAFALVGPPKTRFQLVVNLDWAGLITH